MMNSRKLCSLISARAGSRVFLALWFCVGLDCMLSRAIADEPLEFVHRWQLEPDLGVTWIMDPDRRPKPVNLLSLNSDNLKRCVGQARYVTRYAANIRFAGEQGVVLDTILKRLQRNEQNRQVRLALFSAAVAMSDGEKAEEIWALAKEDVAARPVVEEALIRWRSDVARESWRAILNSGSVGVSELLRSLNGIEVTGDESDLESLNKLINQGALPLPARLAACQAYGEIASNGAEVLARKLLDSGEALGPLMAVHLIASHTSQECLPILNTVFEKGSLPAKARAIPVLAVVSPVQVDDAAEEWLADKDSEIRAATLRALAGMSSEKSLNFIALGLEDTLIENRMLALAALKSRASDKNAGQVISDIVNHCLATGTFRSIEQIIQLVVHLEDHSRCPRLIELLEHPHPAVSNTAAWALERLVKKDDQDFIDKIHVRCEELTAKHFDDTYMTVPDSVQIAFLFEILGKYRVREADEMLQRYIPKYIAPTVARSAAIWALGNVWEDQQNPGVTKKLSGRLHDYSPSDPEDQEVKYVCTIAMAMIAHPNTYADIERFHGRPPNQVGVARQWALDELRSKSNN